jgi:hypothetical protein
MEVDQINDIITGIINEIPNITAVYVGSSTDPIEVIQERYPNYIIKIITCYTYYQYNNTIKFFSLIAALTNALYNTGWYGSSTALVTKDKLKYSDFIHPNEPYNIFIAVEYDEPYVLK